LAEVLETENYERRKIDVDTFEAAKELVDSQIDLDGNLQLYFTTNTGIPA